MSEIKSCFTSRFPNGVILEVDFSQLEVAVLAVLSKDEVLIDDILSGRDMHRWRASELFGIPEDKVTPLQRTLSKRLSFQLQYGAGAQSMAEKNEIDVSLAKTFINNYYARYQRVKKWQEEVAADVKATRTVGAGRTPKGYPQGEGTYVAQTGRIYRFKEYDAPGWSRTGDPTFSPTEMKNYPVQGTATADFMALYRGQVYRKLLEVGDTRHVLPINTVHDSVMFDVFNEHLAVAFYKGVLKTVAEDLPRMIEDLWGIDCCVPLPIEAKVGPHWGALTKLKD